MRHLKKRGLTDVKLIISDAWLGLMESACDFYPEVKWQCCVVHFYRNVFTVVPRGKVNDVARMLKATHASEDKTAAQEKAEAVVVKKLKGCKLHQAAEVVRNGIADTPLSYYDFPDAHWRCIRTNNPLERILREVRHRARVFGACFPGWQLRSHVGGSSASPHRRYALGNTSLSQYGSSKRDGKRRSRCLNHKATALKSAKDS